MVILPSRRERTSPSERSERMWWETRFWLRSAIHERSQTQSSRPSRECEREAEPGRIGEGAKASGYLSGDVGLGARPSQRVGRPAIDVEQVAVLWAKGHVNILTT